MVALRRMAWLAMVGFLLNGNWEWLETPWYDDRTNAINTIVWYRLHCALLDVGILIGAALAVSLLFRTTNWLVQPRPREVAVFTLLGATYTAVSEQVNVAIRGAWSYSPWMPVLPGTSIGVVPLLQWVLLPPVAVWLASRLSR